jgi:peptidyl-prolyl cis-trans isomerase SurA
MKPRLPIRAIAALLAIAPLVATAQFRVPPPATEPRLSVGAPSAPAAPTAARGGPQPIDRVVAIVNAEAITERELTLRSAAIARRLRAQGVELPPEPELQRQVLERMIGDRAQLQAAREAGVRIDDATLDRAIARIAQDAKLDVAGLRKRVESEGTPFSAFRQEVLSEMTISRVRERDIESRVKVSEAEIDAFLAEQGSAPGGAATELNIAQLLVRVPENASEALVSQAQRRAEAFAAAARGGADFARLAAGAGDESVAGGVVGMRPVDRLPPLFVDAVATLSPGEVAPVVRSPAGFHVLKLIARRDAGSPKFVGAPVRQTRARHILVRVNELNPEAEVIRRLTEIRERLEGGTVEFADMARQYSMDGTAGQGGDLGWVYPGDTVPEFERAMDGLEPKQIAGPVRTPFGYHLIQVVERRTDEASPDRVRAAARNALRERKVAEAYQEWVTQVRDRAYVEYRLDDR